MKKGNRFGLNIADMPILVETNDTSNISYIKSMLKDYLKPIKKPYFHILVNSVFSREEFRQENGIRIIPENGRFILMDKRKISRELGFIDKTNRFCRLNICPETTKILFSPFLMSSLSLFLSELNGFIIHSAGLIYQDAAYIFIGPSGSGKTTVASILKEKGLNLISDEKIVIRRSGSRFKAYTCPWAKDRNQSAPLKSIFFLKKGKRVNFWRLNPPDAISRILSNITLNIPDPEIAQKILKTLCSLFKNVPCYEMEFLKNDLFWDRLNNLN